MSSAPLPLTPVGRAHRPPLPAFLPIIPSLPAAVALFPSPAQERPPVFFWLPPTPHANAPTITEPPSRPPTPAHKPPAFPRPVHGTAPPVGAVPPTATSRGLFESPPPSPDFFPSPLSLVPASPSSRDPLLHRNSPSVSPPKPPVPQQFRSNSFQRRQSWPFVHPAPPQSAVHL